MITAEQLRAARSMVRMEQADLAGRVGISAATIKRMEGGSGPVRGSYENVAAIQRELEAAGVEFLPDNGLRLRRAPAEADR